MSPDPTYYFGGGGDTLLSPVALGILIVCSTLMLLLPRKYIIVPFFFASFMVPVSQQIVLAGLHFMVFRLLILAGWVRMIWSWFFTRRDPFPGRMNLIDKAFVLWALSNAVMYTILWGEVGALVNRLGFLYTGFGAYFLLRWLVRGREDVISAIKVLSVVALCLAVAMWVENVTGRNAFSMFGRLSEFSEVRYGRVRAQGPFLHSIVAGTIGAMLLPLFIGLWWEGKGNRLVAGVGVLSSTAMTFASASSTPAMTYLAGLAGLCFWPFRRHMQLVRWGLVLSLVTLHLVMQAPVWFLISRVSSVTGGTGWHRAVLIDYFLRRFNEWWLIGTQDNARWGFDMWDVVNAYVYAGLEGGLITFILFISLLTCVYRSIGAARRQAENDRRSERLIWAVGASVFANTVAFFGIIYFDQSVIAWYALLVMVSAATATFTQPERTRSESETRWAPAESLTAGLKAS